MSQPPKYLGHFTVFVCDVARAKQWYADLLRLHTDPDAGGPTAFLSRGPEAAEDVALIQGDDGALSARVGRCSTVWRFDSLDDLAALYRRARARGIAIDHVADHGYSLSLYLRDPDGNDVEVYYELPPAEWRRQADDFDSQFYGRAFLAPGAFPGPWDEVSGFTLSAAAD